MDRLKPLAMQKSHNTGRFTGIASQRLSLPVNHVKHAYRKKTDKETRALASSALSAEHSYRTVPVSRGKLPVSGDLPVVSRYGNGGFATVRISLPVIFRWPPRHLPVVALPVEKGLGEKAGTASPTPSARARVSYPSGLVSQGT
jgi:hypothetical protein